jgi:hypothetical protein
MVGDMRGCYVNAKQIGEYHEGRNRSLPDVTEQQSKGHESREPAQESPKHGSGTYAREDGAVYGGRGWREDRRARRELAHTELWRRLSRPRWGGREAGKTPQVTRAD